MLWNHANLYIHLWLKKYFSTLNLGTDVFRIRMKRNTQELHQFCYYTTVYHWEYFSSMLCFWWELLCTLASLIYLPLCYNNSLFHYWNYYGYGSKNELFSSSGVKSKSLTHWNLGTVLKSLGSSLLAILLNPKLYFEEFIVWTTLKSIHSFNFNITFSLCIVYNVFASLNEGMQILENM